MVKRIVLALVGAAAVLNVSVLMLRAQDAKPTENKERFFELRTYHCNEGKLDALNARFRNHTNALFQRHGMELVGYWMPVDQKDTLIYVLAYPSKEAREKAWKEFGDDPDWKKARTESEKDGALVKKVDSVFMTPTDYSPIR